MTKEALDRIKEAYYSGLKVQIWFDGYWKNFDVRDYPINTDPFSEHRMYRIVGSAYVDIAEKQIADLKKENAELKEAKEIIRALLFHLNKDTFAVIYETREESIKKAEQFLKEMEK